MATQPRVRKGSKKAKKPPQNRPSRPLHTLLNNPTCDPQLHNDLELLQNSFPDANITKAQALNDCYSHWLSNEAAYAADSTFQRLSNRALAKKYGVLESTLRYRIKNKRSKAAAVEERQRLTPLEEQALRNWCLQLEAWGFPARIETFRFMVESMLRAKGDYMPLGHSYQQRFFLRFPDLKSKFAPPLDKARAAAEDPVVWQKYFSLFESLVAEHKIEARDIYNMDEKGFMQGIFEKSKVICSRDERFHGQPYCIQDGSREWTTIIDCVSMGDQRYLSPFIIFKGTYCKKPWARRVIDYDSNSKIVMSYNGWTDNCIAVEWFKQVFLPQTGGDYLYGKYRMLLFDGHASHISTEVITLCLQNDVILLCLPAHSTHKLQPLDVGLFGPLATYYKHEIRDTCKFGYQYSVDKPDFINAYLLARDKAYTAENIKHSWKAVGLYPFNPSLVIDSLPPLVIVSERPSTPPYLALKDIPSKTPRNVNDIRKVLESLRAGQITSSNYQEILTQLAKAAERSMAESITYQDHNTELQSAATRRNTRENRAGGNLTKREARVYGKEALYEREIWAVEKLEAETFIAFGRMCAIFDEKPAPKKKSKKINSPTKQLGYTHALEVDFEALNLDFRDLFTSPVKQKVGKVIEKVIKVVQFESSLIEEQKIVMEGRNTRSRTRLAKAGGK